MARIRRVNQRTRLIKLDFDRRVMYCSFAALW